MKNWTGNKRSTFSTLGASNHSNYDRAEYDFYATDPIAIDMLLEKITPKNKVWENAAGNGHLSKRLIEKGFDVFSSDIVDREFPVAKIDFLKDEVGEYADIVSGRDIITNPPYRWAKEWVERAMDLLDEGGRLFLFLKITFLEGQKRKEMFKKYPPKYVLVFSKRIQVAINGDENMFKKSSAACYAWFVWEKGFNGSPIIDWL